MQLLKSSYKQVPVSIDEEETRHCFGTHMEPTYRELISKRWQLWIIVEIASCVRARRAQGSGIVRSMPCSARLARFGINQGRVGNNFVVKWIWGMGQGFDGFVRFFDSKWHAEWWTRVVGRFRPFHWWLYLANLLLLLQRNEWEEFHQFCLNLTLIDW